MLKLATSSVLWLPLTVALFCAATRAYLASGKSPLLNPTFLTLAGVIVLPLLLLPSRKIGDKLRTITRDQLQFLAAMNSLMSETLNVSGALLVKIFGRQHDEISRFDEKATEVRDLSIRRNLVMR